MNSVEMLYLVAKVGGTVNTYSDGYQDVVLTTDQLEAFVNLILEKKNGNT